MVQQFLSRLAANPDYCAFDWTVEDMAQASGLGKTQFVHYCRQLTNLSPSRYLQQCRLAAAARQLRECGNEKITDVALQNGFSSSQYFATKFREHFGCSPGEYQKQVTKTSSRG
jgi:AraC family L-rhamnose operon regulatory protein RhaS